MKGDAQGRRDRVLSLPMLTCGFLGSCEGSGCGGLWSCADRCLGRWVGSLTCRNDARRVSGVLRWIRGFADWGLLCGCVRPT